MIQPGTYVVKIASHAISETKAGLPQAAITFSNGLTWFGSFKEGKAREITLKALLTCGLKGNNPAGPLEIGREVSIVVDDETGEDGKTRTKVRWVNALGGGIKNVISPDHAKAKLQGLEGAVMAARSEHGGSDDSEIPF